MAVRFTDSQVHWELRVWRDEQLDNLMRCGAFEDRCVSRPKRPRARAKDAPFATSPMVPSYSSFLIPNSSLLTPHSTQNTMQRPSDSTCYTPFNKPFSFKIHYLT
ncbi:uncharacterized protein [Fopius arisanus]|uniref:Uncharacterized protein n=1 Tax=Fopius arisanus TaxID=64838 RepID=A0A9R1U3B6_9HYME|nr:PREDICTED: uncharacterized protein LOC105268027 [Fopius arisanus]